MNDIKYKQLVEKLGSYIDDDGVDPSVSPTLGSDSGRKTTSAPLYLTPEMDVEQLSEDDVTLAHSLLHKFYRHGGTKNLTKNDIEELHSKIKDKIEHFDFDRLDRK